MNVAKELTLRTKFQLKNKLVNWFPGHMNKGIRQIERTLRKVDCILEVHDSRIPLSGRNVNFTNNLSSVKPHILIMSKIDLIDFRFKNAIKKRLEENQSNSKVIFVDSLNPNTKINGFSEILPTVINLVETSNRFNRSDSFGINLMIIGIPNVGKSTIINKLRNNYYGVKGRPAETGAIAGVTRSVMERIRINANPPIYLYDTPGVLEPRVERGVETIMRCALCATLNDQMIGYRNIADYLLYWLNRHNDQSYVRFLNLDKPSDDINEVLIKGAVSLHCLKRFKNADTGEFETRPDMDKTAQAFVNAFRTGKLGRFVLDDDII